jgi:tight adherence protein C
MTMAMIYLIYGLIFISAFILVFFLLKKNPAESIQERIQASNSVQGGTESVLGKLSPLAEDHSKSIASDGKSLKIKLVQAGFLSLRAPWLFQGAKALCALLFLSIALTSITLFGQIKSTPVFSLILIFSFAIGFYLPDLVLARLTLSRQRVIFNSFPDALDLIRMCVQSGLGLDQSLDRVGKEMVLTCPELSKELEMTGLELRAGISRADSLRNLSSRIGLSDVDSFVVTLIQSDRFGNSVADALSIYSDSLRSKRRIASEELAAKLPIKLMIPLVFCIFPSLLTVLLGPAIVHIHNRLIPVLGT